MTPITLPADLRALSLLQPWASVLLQDKDVENRPRPLPPALLGVPIVVHASARRDEREWLAYRRLVFEQGLPAPVPSGGYPYGALIGLVRFSRCATHHDSPWFFGPYGYVKAQAVALPTPIPCRGMLGFWRVPADNVARLAAQIEGMTW